ncbi:MAG: gephyrin-like molybdotransferase Glp [Bacteroidota bacterium]
MISYNEAVEIIGNEFKQLPKKIIEVNLLDAAGFVLAEDIYADINLPPFDHSNVDGFGVKFNGDRKEWKVEGELSAGNYNEFVVTENTAIRIMTGGKIPPGIDTVIQMEDVDEIDGIIYVKKDIRIRSKQNVRTTGEDLLKNELALSKGIRLSPQNLTLAAACGKSKIKVYAKLNVGVLSTGDELVDIDIVPTQDKIRATNLYSLILLIQQANMNPINFGLVKDNKEELKARIFEMLNSDLDLLITTGGVSVGKYDFLQDILKELGTKILFWKVYIKPGKPLVLGKYRNGNSTKLVFGLPGNPVSSFVNFLIFIKFALENYLGVEKTRNVHALLDTPLKKKDLKRHFFRGILRYETESKKYFVSEAGHQSSGNISGLSMANCLIVVPEEILNPKIGDEVVCIEI